MYAQFNRFEIKMTLAQAQGASHQGQCDADVRALSERPEIRRQLKKIPQTDISAELAEYGAWDSLELSDADANEQRVLWIAASNIVDDRDAKR